MNTKLHTYPTVRHAAKRLQDKAVVRLGSMTPAQLEVQRRFVPRAVIKNIEGLSSGNSGSEMRVVSVIFCCISGVDVSTDSGAQVAQELLYGAQEAVYNQEGSVN